MNPVTNYDFATVKYNAAGVELWHATYDGPWHTEDRAHALAVDNEGNVYVTGQSAGSDFNMYDYATIKYDAAGVEQWVAHFIGISLSGNRPTDIAVDYTGNVYVTGSSASLETGYDYATVKYNTNGIEQWVARYKNGEAKAISVDGLGNIYVTGSGEGPVYATLKYNSSGNEEWVNLYYGPDSIDHGWATAIAIDDSGNVYVTGGSNSSNGNEFATIKYNTSGVEQWAARYSHGNGADGAVAIALDASGNIIVTGRSESGYIGGPFWGTSINDYTTVKYNSSGVKQWAVHYEGPDSLNDEVTDIAVDATGNIYVTGFSESSESGADYATIKYNPNGIEQWVIRTNAAQSIAVDGTGSVIVAGGLTTIKFAQTGTGFEKTEEIHSPCQFSLKQNYPNPFNPSTKITFTLPKSEHVTLEVYNTLGQKVATLLDRKMNAGSHDVQFEASALPSGIYFYRIQVADAAGRTGEFSQVRKMVLLR